METQIAISNLIDRILEHDTLAEWEFLYIHTNAFLRANMTTDRIGKSYEYKLVGRNVRANPDRIQALSKLLRSASLMPRSVKMDVRYAFIMRDNNQRALLSLYQNFSNRYIQINDSVYDVNRELSRWFQNLARDVLKIA